MPTRKKSKKPARKAVKTAKGKSLDLPAIKAGRMVLYGLPIRDAILRGNLAEMRQLAVAARAHVREVQSALSALEAALNK